MQWRRPFSGRLWSSVSRLIRVVSSFGSDFNYDYQVSQTAEEKASGQAYYNYTLQQFPSDERPGLSVFAKDAGGDIFHTYSTYGRGLDILVGAYNFIDLVPKGRDEAGLKHSMAWVRRHDQYDGAYFVDAEAEYEQPKLMSEMKPHSCCSGE